MANGQLGAALRHLRTLLGAEEARVSSDGELLQRFALHNDQAAFAALVERYAGLVTGVCRRVLQSEHDAEDTFQATFLVLARKAGTLDGTGTVANWLYTVAYHLALKAKARSGQRRAHERQVADMPEVESQTDTTWNDLKPLLDEELDRLPAKYRSPMVLCYLVGKTNDEAARELGWTKDTVRGRLARAREMLRNRLTRRGITVTSTALGAVLVANAAQATAPAAWVQATVQAGVSVAAGTAAVGVSASVAALVDAGLKSLFLAKVKVAAILVLAVGVVTTGVGISASGNRPGRSSTAARVAERERRVPAAKEQVPEVADPMTECPEDAEKEEPEPENISPESASEPDPPEPPAVTMKRRDTRTEEELRRQLVRVPELDIDTDKERTVTERMWKRLEQPEDKPAEKLPVHFTRPMLKDRRDLAGLPLRQGTDCELTGQAATDMDFLSREMRGVLGDILSPPNGNRPGAEPHLVALALGKNLRDRSKNFGTDEKLHFNEAMRSPGAVATLMQMLTAEATDIRLVLVEQLRRISHPAASEALARLAVFDLAPEVRALAVRCLAERPREEYRNVLLSGLRYPWAPAADHAAEALVALKDVDAVPALKDLLRERDPALPFLTAEKTPVVREVVRINHLRNCMLCHAPAQGSAQLLRGRIPTPGYPLPPLTTYYVAGGGNFVRADITYLRQDFSVAQMVPKTDERDRWPSLQRYDYLVRLRPLRPSEMNTSEPEPTATFPQREAILFALKELSTEP